MRVEIFPRKTNFEGINSKLRFIDEFLSETSGLREAVNVIDETEAERIKQEIEEKYPNRIVIYFAKEKRRV